LPTAAAKERAWTSIATDRELGVNELFAACEGFWHPAQLQITAPYVDRYFAEIGGTAELRSGMAVSITAGKAFPQYDVDERVVVLAEQLASDEKVAPGIRRRVADMADDLRRAVAVRAAFRPSDLPASGR
jgi:aminopeptidase N